MTYPPPGAPHDGDHHELAGLDFSVRGEDAGEPDLGAVLGEYSDDASGDDPAGPTFTVANPPGTVTVTASMDGHVHQVDLSPMATTLTESVLSEEIVVIAGLATQDARSAQYEYMLDGMREHGHDNVTTRDFLNRDLDLPTPEQARAARAELFAARYAGEE
ncbi:MAG: hypothetical protein KDB44_16840 [Mycobacterium sp.]|nr:hypothetical protein [Mycobacterium sp.]